MADWREVANIKLVDNSAQVLNAEKKAIEAALTKIGIAAKRNIQQIIMEKHIYDTGDLYRSIDYKVDSSDKKVTVGSPQHYAPYQELSTLRIPARPFVRPGIMDHIDEYKRIVEDTLKG